MQPELIATGELERSIEALLFVAGESLSIDKLARLTQSPHVDVTRALAAIAETYAERGIVLREVAGGYRFASSPAARAVVETYLLPPKTTLSPAAMETLAIIAYLQPATKAEIEAVRGVNVDSVVTTLLDRRFIAEAGRREVVGRPLEFKTTAEFLESFGLRSLTELPRVDFDAPVELALPMRAEGPPLVVDAGLPPGEPPSIEADPGDVPESPSIETEVEEVPENVPETGEPATRVEVAHAGPH